MELLISSAHANLNVDTRGRFNLELLWEQIVGSAAVPVDGYEIALASWMVPWKWHGTHARNNVVVFSANSVDYAITIPTGTYDSEDLAVYLQNTMNSIAASEGQFFSVTYDVNRGTMVFNKTSGTGSWNFVTTAAVSATEASPATAGTYTFSAYDILGFFEPTSGTDITAAAANGEDVESTRGVEQDGVERLFLETNWPDVRTYDARTHGHNTSLGQMSPYGKWGTKLIWTAPKLLWKRCYKLPAQLEVALLDHLGREVDLNGNDWYFSIAVRGLEGMTPMGNMMEAKHDTRQQVAQRNIRATVYAPPTSASHDAPSRSWQGHKKATTSNYGSGVQLNPQRGANPFTSPI
jgi:hypothetical protein